MVTHDCHSLSKKMTASCTIIISSVSCHIATCLFLPFREPLLPFPVSYIASGSMGARLGFCADSTVRGTTSHFVFECLIRVQADNMHLFRCQPQRNCCLDFFANFFVRRSIFVLLDALHTFVQTTSTPLAHSVHIACAVHLPTMLTQLMDVDKAVKPASEPNQINVNQNIRLRGHP